MLTIRKRYVLFGTNGIVAFWLKPTAAVTGEGFVPGMGPRNFAPWAKYIRPESRKIARMSNRFGLSEVIDNEIDLELVHFH